MVSTPHKTLRGEGLFGNSLINWSKIWTNTPNAILIASNAPGIRRKCWNWYNCLADRGTKDKGS